MPNRFFDILFTDGVKSAQTRYGSREHYRKRENESDRNFELGDAEYDFIESRDGFYMATASERGYPYIQFRGGPRGFLKALDSRRLGFADFRGNLQYLSMGNLLTNAKAALFLMDYANRRRLKLIADVEVTDAKENPGLIEQLAMPGYAAKIERAVVLNIKAFDWNCPQHITPRYTIDEVRELARPMQERIESLEKELASLREVKNERIY